MATLPKSPGTRNRSVFQLARRLKAIPTLADASMSDLRPHVMEWHRRALPTIDTEDFETTWFDFAYGWDKVKYAHGRGPIQLAYEQSLIEGTPRCAEMYTIDGIKRLAGLCRELQRIAGDEPFFIGVRTAADVLGVDKDTAWRWLRLLMVDEIIKLDTKGALEKGKPPRASRYRWLKDP